jgi:hypothetical protein
MKKYILYGLAKNASRNLNHYQKQRLLKRLKYFVAFAFVGTLLLGGLAIWGTVAAVSKFAGSVNQETIMEGVSKGQEGLIAIASQPLTTKNCLDVMGGMLSPERLLTVPLAESIESLRGACWGKPSAVKDQQKQG